MGVALRIPLRPLDPPPPAPRTESPTPEPPTRIDLDAPAPLAQWARTTGAATEAVVLLDPDGRVVAVSPAAVQLLGLDAATSLGALLTDLVVVVDAGAAALPLTGPGQLPCLRVLAGHGPVSRALVRVRRAPGPAGLVALDAVGLAVEGGALAYFSPV